MSTVKTPKGTDLPLINLKGKAYLQVAHRLVWFREEHPDWSIETEFTYVDLSSALAKATVKDASGRIIATGHKFEDKQGFHDYREKSETGAIGRALALCGYGTQFTDDLEEGDRLADAPVQQLRPRGVYPDKPAIQDGIQMEVDALGDYVIQIGQKYKGRMLKDVSIDELQSFVKWLDAESEKARKPHAPKTLEFINHATRYIIHMENEWAKEAGSRG